jgi:hypothetical protein
MVVRLLQRYAHYYNQQNPALSVFVALCFQALLLSAFKFASQIFARLSIVQTSLTLHSAYANIRLKLVWRPINCLFAKRKEISFAALLLATAYMNTFISARLA